MTKALIDEELRELRWSEESMRIDAYVRERRSTHRHDRPENETIHSAAAYDRSVSTSSARSLVTGHDGDD
jgi:hypothetical protein